MLEPGRFNRYDAYKVAALIGMTVNHLGHYLWPEILILRIVGLGAPLFAFLVGWNHSYRFRSVLLIAAIVMSAVQWGLGLATGQLNILWAILAARLILIAFEKHARPSEEWLLVAVALVAWLPLVPAMEYGSLVLVWALWGRAARMNPESIKTRAYAMLGSLSFMVCMMLSLPMDHGEIIAQSIMTFAMWFGLRHFHACTITRDYPLLRFWSRHALSYYVLHRSLLMAMAVLR